MSKEAFLFTMTFFAIALVLVGNFLYCKDSKPDEYTDFD